MKQDRRGFLNTLLGIGGIGAIASIIYPVFEFLLPPESREPTVSSIKAGAIDQYEVNSAKILKFGREPVILIRKDSGEFSAFSATCTHLDCIVQYRQDTKQILCACHNGHYDLKGRNVSGPPPKPLTEFKVSVINNEITISTMEG